MRPASYIRAFPKVVRVEPASACNLRCSHCPTGTVNMTRGVMKPDTFELVVQNISENIDSVKVVVLYHGGEPLLHKGFPGMAKHLKTLGVPLLKTVSNGMLLTRAAIAEIVDSGLDEIEFSLDGDSPAENNLVRRNCDYSTVVRNVKHLIRYIRQAGSETPHVLISTVQFGDPRSDHMGCQKPDVPEFLLREFDQEYSRGVVRFKPTWAMRWPHMAVVNEVYDVCHDPSDTEVRNSCDHVDSTITIRWNGDVVACCYDLTSQHVLGNVHADSLPAIWNGKPYLALRRSIDRMKFVPMCANCSVVKPNVYLTLKPGIQAGLREAQDSAGTDFSSRKGHNQALEFAAR